MVKTIVVTIVISITSLYTIKRQLFSTIYSNAVCFATICRLDPIIRLLNN